MNISQYISQLLYSQSHVIIPNFGGFVCQDFRAEINEATQMFMPPSKRLSFQSGMTDFDDSLVNAIVQGENLTFDVAAGLVKKVTNDWSEKLTLGEHVKLEGIGRLFRNSEAELSFQADINANFDASSFGLSIFRFPELKGQPKNTLNVQGNLINNVKSTGISKYWQIAAVFVGVVGLFYIGTQKADFNGSNFASINPLVFSKTTSVKLDEVTANEDVVVIESLQEEVIEKEVKEENLTANLDNEIEPSQVNVNKPYNIIVGAFGVKANADSYLQKLKNEGHENAVSFLEKGLYKVSINQFVSKKEAKESLLVFKRSTNKGAWIYRR